MPTCLVSFCERAVRRDDGGRRGYCRFHYDRVKLAIDPETASADPDWRRRPGVRDDYFASIDTPNQAYLLGMMVADGCIETDYTISLIQHEQDIALLRFFLAELGVPDHAIDRNPTRPAYRTRVGARRLVVDLARLGVGPRKSATVALPVVAPALHAPLILGIFDGDGSIVSNLPKRYVTPQVHIEFSGSEPTLAGIRVVLSSACDLNPGLAITHRTGGCYRLSVNGRQQVARVGAFLYSNPPTFYLARKRERFHSLLY